MSLESFTPAEIESAMAASLDFYMKGQPLSQTIQEKPLWAKLLKGKKTFPGSRGEIKKNVKGTYTSSFQGYTGDDTVQYRNPANIKQATAPWFELHAGLSCTYTELKSNGISVNNTAGDSTSRHSDARSPSSPMSSRTRWRTWTRAPRARSTTWRGKTALRTARRSRACFPSSSTTRRPAPVWASIAPSLVDERGNTTGAIARWSAASKITPSAANQTLTLALKDELRQLPSLRRRPEPVDRRLDALKGLEVEAYSKGYLTQTGFTDGDTSIQVPNVMIPGLGRCIYDPTLDDLGREDFMYMIDTKHLYLMVMQNEEFKQHSPERPPEKYVLYKGLTWTGCLFADQLNCHGVYRSQLLRP
jgi:hypothetical protein